MCDLRSSGSADGRLSSSKSGGDGDEGDDRPLDVSHHKKQTMQGDVGQRQM